MPTSQPRNSPGWPARRPSHEVGGVAAVTPMVGAEVGEEAPTPIAMPSTWTSMHDVRQSRVGGSAIETEARKVVGGGRMAAMEGEVVVVAARARVGVVLAAAGRRKRPRIEH